MNFFRKLFVAAAFVVLSAALFTALMPLVLHVLLAYYGRFAVNPPDGVFVASWVAIAIGIATATVAAAFYLFAVVLLSRSRVEPSRTIV